MRNDPKALIAVVLDLADSVPPGRVTTYGHIAAVTKLATGKGSARHVGQVMAHHSADLAWWRVVRADGSLPMHLRDVAMDRYLEEGTPLIMKYPLVVDLRACVWTFDNA